MMTEHCDVCGVIVAAGVCSGCGVCAGICPRHNLSLAFNRYGEYTPVKGPLDCPPQCDLCLRACPFWNQADNEDTLAQRAFGAQPGIQHRPETGYYLESFVGHSNVNGHRANGASGGLATWFLETLLAEDVVDGVICVSASPISEAAPSCQDSRTPLFRFAVLRSVEEVRAASRSCYYPVEISQAIHELLATPGRYAVIGLPCVLKGLRLAMRANARLRERITIMAGLVCGGQQSALFADYICALGRGDPSSLTNVTFRVKEAGRPANDHGTHFICAGGEPVERTIFWSQGVGEAWGKGIFQLSACGYCDDVFAEVADVTFMDAWLPTYQRDPSGTNLVTVRSAQLLPLFAGASRSGALSLQPIGIEQVIHSQADLILKKRGYLSVRLGCRQTNTFHCYTLSKRVSPQRVNFAECYAARLDDYIRLTERNTFQASRTSAAIAEMRQATRLLKLARRGLRKGLAGFAAIANLVSS
jgi:coenzyme F420 hydrogenase subunit beta